MPLQRARAGVCELTASWLQCRSRPLAAEPSAPDPLDDNSDEVTPRAGW